MTGLHADPPRRRAEDKGTLIGRFTGWWRRWKDPIIAPLAILTAIACLYLGYRVYEFNKDRAQDAKVVRVIVQEQAKISAAREADARATATAARISCMRSRQFGPVIADFYLKNGLDPKLIARYRETIPKTCPSK